MELTNSYTCQLCGIEFNSKEELGIKEGKFPICSSHCLFMLYYRILSNYPKEWLLILAESLEVRDFNNLLEQSLLFEVCKKYPKQSLSSINPLVTEMDTYLDTLIVTKQVTRLHHSPFYSIERDVTVPVTKFKVKGGLDVTNSVSKW